MYINTLLKQKNMTKYKLAKLSGVPNTTVVDICSGKTAISKCTVETLYKLAKVLDISMEELVVESTVIRPEFEYFKSTICHMVNDMGDIDFMIHTLESDKIRKLFNREWYLESLYLLAMVDYLSRENDFPLCMEYNDLRNARLQKIVYPLGVHVRCIAGNSTRAMKECIKNAIPEFLRHNIVESEIRNVV